MAINFPNAPVIGELYTEQNITYAWDGSSWILGDVVASSGAAVPDYDPITGTYVIDQLVAEQGILYRCIIDVAAPEVFNPAKWQAFIIDGGTGF